MNMDDFRNYDTIKETDIRMNIKKADFVCIQETHNTKDMEIYSENYKIYLSKATNENNNDKGIGGVAIMVRKNLVNTITNIKRISNRNISIQIKISKNTNLKIINTYAPHMGYNKGERTGYWKEVNKTLEQIIKMTV